MSRISPFGSTGLRSKSNALSRTISAAAALTLASSVSAQSVNFDYSTNFGSGPWFNAPADAFGGAHGQTGHWMHSEALLNWSNLPGLDGDPTTIDLARSGGTGVVSFMDHPVLNGEIEKMIGDWARADAGDPVLTLTFSSLSRGVYTVYTYAVNPIFDTYRSTVTVAGSIDGPQNVGGAITGNAPVQGVTHARHRVNCTTGTITIQIAAGVSSGSFNGVQLVFHGSPPVSTHRLYVDQAAGAPGAGLSWTSPCQRLEDALTVAEVAGEVEEVWVADGIYRPTRNGNRADSFVISDGVKVYGGFAGGETQLAQRDIAANPTTLTGAINSILTSVDNSYHVVDLSNTGAATRLDGFRITNGYASGGGNESFGGGVFMLSSSASVRNCTIQNNHADLGGGLWGNGDSPDVVNCTFFNNEAEIGGGGARVLTGEFVASFYNCRFIGNQSDGAGGGAYVTSRQAWFYNCLFDGNSAALEGGAIHSNGEDGDIQVANSTLAFNSSADTCGGIYLAGGADDTIINSILWGNTDADFFTNTRQAQYFAFDASNVQTLDYNIVQGWNIIDGVGNNGSNPLFADPDGVDNVAGNLDDDLRVAANSPAIDSGDNSGLGIDWTDVDDDGVFFEENPLDLDGQARRYDIASVLDTGAGTSPLVDRGPYEAQPACPWDVNGDSAVNVVDLLAVITNWGAAGANPADVTGDLVVNVNDLLAVITHWGGCP